MAPHLTSSVLVGGVVLPAGTEETAKLRAAISNTEVWSAPTELSDDELQAAVPPADVSEQPRVDVDGQVAAAVEAAVAMAVDGLREELVAEVTRQIEELVGVVEPAEVNGQDDTAAAVAEPPRGGKGSGEPEWRAYADHLGVDVTGVSDRDGIIALVDQHKAASR